MDCNKSFSSHHLLLNHKEVHLFDLASILFSSNLKKRKFIDSSQSNEHVFGYRLNIFISILAQKVLQLVSVPLAFFGFMLELFLNLVSNNGGIGKIFLNFFTGKLIVPEKSSANFHTFLGHLDRRLEMDNSIEPGDERYFPALSMMASKISYENKACVETTVKNLWKMDFLGFYNYRNEYQEKATTQVFMLRQENVDHDVYMVAFRGTQLFNADDWCSDVDVSWYELPGVGKIHGGFMKALGLKKSQGWPKELKQEDKQKALAYYDIREKLRKFLSENRDAKFIVTGHSLGGALAVLFPAILAMHDEKSLLERLEGVYTYGQPRVGDGTFGEFVENKFREHHVKYLRIVYGSDMVPRLPPDDKMLLFKHFGTCLFYDRHYEGKRVAVLPYKNYFSLLAAIPMIINAFFELMRSFTIGATRGSDYVEGALQIAFRIIGLLLPGVSAHGPQDYVNSTRLSSPEVLSKDS